MFKHKDMHLRFFEYFQTAGYFGMSTKFFNIKHIMKIAEILHGKTQQKNPDLIGFSCLTAVLERGLWRNGVHIYAPQMGGILLCG